MVLVEVKIHSAEITKMLKAFCKTFGTFSKGVRGAKRNRSNMQILFILITPYNRE